MKGDVILEFDGVKLTELPDLRTVIRAHKVGDTVKIEVLRGEEGLEKEFTFGTRPPPPK